MAKNSNRSSNESKESLVRPVDNPIICSPYIEPNNHWEYSNVGEPQLISGRRPASYWWKSQKVFTGQTSLFAEEQREDLPLINLIREDVRRWRDSKYEMATPTTKKLLEHWNNPNRERTLFFCQKESVETIIYINEILVSKRKLRWNPKLTYEDYIRLSKAEQPSFVDVLIKDKMLLPRFVDIPNDSDLLLLTRYGCKMATGSGKTVVMAMIIAWAFCNRGSQPSDIRFPDAALICCPNLTIRERLQVLRPDIENNYFKKFDLVPAVLVPVLNKGLIKIMNWHQLAPESEKTEGGSSYRIVNKGEETKAAFSKRVLGDLFDHGPIMILNDEGHHAYRPKPLDDDSDLTEEEKKEREEATVWVDGLDKINNSCGVKFCIDLSATPFYIKGSGYIEGSPFPWLVSDFGLVDAIESGIVKIPRIPVSDITGLPEPKYYNLWKVITADLKAGQKLQGGRPKPEVVWERANDAIQQLAGQYKERFDYYTQGNELNLSVPPVMIVVCDNTNIAELFYKNISGEEVIDVEEKIIRGKKKGSTKLAKKTTYGQGKIFPDIFSNKENIQNTLRIDSKIISETDSEDQSKDETKKQIREIVDTVGQKGKSGEQIKCVVSVQMLTEGWDANNVTHIIGLRAFLSQLLVEQVVGRGLRRMNYTPDPETGMLPPEYVDVYGIPFSLVPTRGRPVGKKAPEDKPVNHVKALPDRKHLEIKFPIVESYVFDLKENLIKIDFEKIEQTIVEPLKNPTATFIQPQFGFNVSGLLVNPNLQVVVQDRHEYYDNTHLQTIKFEITRHIVHNLTFGRDMNKPKLQHNSRMQLFPQVYEIVDRYIEEKVNYKGCDKKEIGLENYSKRVIELLTAAIEPDDTSGEPPLLPQLNKYKPVGSSDMVNFTTKKTVKGTIKSHVNAVVADTKSWEQAAAFTLDNCPIVQSYVRNDHLEYNIPYEFEHVVSFYEPDFIVRLINDLNIVLEIKGYEDNRTKAKHQGAKKWISAINNWGKLGKWEFLVCRDPALLESQILHFK